MQKTPKTKNIVTSNHREIEIKTNVVSKTKKIRVKSTMNDMTHLFSEDNELHNISTCTSAAMSYHDSIQTLSVLKLEFPNSSQPNVLQPGLFKVCQMKETNNCNSSKSTENPKRRGHDFNSSSNSHFSTFIQPVTKTRRTKCFSSNSFQGNSRVKSNEQSKVKKVESMLTSYQLVDIQHHKSIKRYNLNGPEWNKPCKASFVAGAPHKYIGHCPYNYEKLSKLARSKQKFYLTQDPRKTYCLVNPDMLRAKVKSKEKQFDIVTKMVRNAQNTCVVSTSDSSESFICEVIDLENPLNLDFQGLDYKNTYQKDEQELQNQRAYRRICRFMERKAVKKDTAAIVEHELLLDRIAIPKRFNLRSRHDRDVSQQQPKEYRSGKLYRSFDKPYNRMMIQKEREDRIRRYKQLYLFERKRHMNEEAVILQNRKEFTENLGVSLANKSFTKFLEHIEDTIQRNFVKVMLLQKSEPQRRVFPHTIRETRVFKHNLKARNRIRHNEAIIKRDFYHDRLNIEKHYRELDLKISSESDKQTELSQDTELSTDDEDNLNVGCVGEKFNLRGFHFLLGDSIRGKFHERQRHKGTSKPKGCMIRDQWLRELAPKKQQIKVDIEQGIQKKRNYDDPRLELFKPNFGWRVPNNFFSAVKRFQSKPLGHHYDRILRKNLKFVQPRLRYHVKKFNLISYRFGDTSQRFGNIKDEKPFPEKRIKLNSTFDYMETKTETKRLRFEESRRKRMMLLGIPCKPIKKSTLQTKCENSESTSNSEWVPDGEPEYNECEDILRSDKKVVNILPVHLRTNMPAPKFREPTLRQHPRHPRDYENLRIDSKIFNNIVATSHIPYMVNLPADILRYANVALNKRPYTSMFDARHHHDHWIPTQEKNIDVHYVPHVVKAEITKNKAKKKQVAIEEFKLAYPPCNTFFTTDLTLHKWNIQEMVEENFLIKKKKPTITDQVNKTQKCNIQDFIYHSRYPNEFLSLNYYGRQAYLQFLREIKIAFVESKNTHNDNELSNDVNKANLIADLEEDLISIESCLTSLSSSDCTNLTNDSGSFLLMESKEKIPLDYIRKSLVPFVELHRSRFQAEPIDVYKQNANPWIVMPFSGQRKIQLDVMMPKDSFFTFNTRLKNGLRLRLEVPIDDVREKLMGRPTNKYKNVVTTDIDENYVEELKSRPLVKMYNFKSGRNLIKDALRMKFESLLIQGQIVRAKISDRLNDQHWEDMQKVKLMFDKLFAKWEKREYEASMAVVYKVKTYYDETDYLKNDFRNLEREFLIFNMDIVFIEGHWIRCVMLQNFHYLMGDQQWRSKHDWIHGIYSEVSKSYELENYDESIMKRSWLNIRQREKDDAWAIKQFYENIYLPNKHTIQIVFPNSESFMDGLESLKAKTFVLLLEMHFTLAIHTELQDRLETFVEWCTDDLKEKDEYVNRKCAKLYFMEDRANWLRTRAMNFIDEPIAISFDNDNFNRDRAFIMEVWRNMVPSNMRGSSEEDLDAVDMIAMISDIVMDTISKFEFIPMDFSRKVEQQHRARCAYSRKQSKQAYQIEKRIEMEMRKVVRNLEPPYEKPHKGVKLPRYMMKKREFIPVVYEKKITERTKFFFRAFHEDGEVMQTTDIRDSLAQVDTMQEQIVPFYFDHFLKLNGYTPNYNFKTQVEMRDGPELNRLKVRSIVPEIVERIKKWEEKRKKIMEDHISQNPKMYIDVI